MGKYLKKIDVIFFKYKKYRKIKWIQKETISKLRKWANIPI